MQIQSFSDQFKKSKSFYNKKKMPARFRGLITKEDVNRAFMVNPIVPANPRPDYKGPWQGGHHCGSIRHRKKGCVLFPGRGQPSITFLNSVYNGRLNALRAAQ